MIWGDISRYVNEENVLGGVVYKNKIEYYQVKGGVQEGVYIEFRSKGGCVPVDPALQ